MVLRTFVAFDNEALVVDSSSSAGIVGNPIINNSSTPNGTIFTYNGGFATDITLDDTGGGADTFNDDQSGSHTITDGGGIVANGNQVESESIITVRALDGSGNPTGPNIDIYVFSQNGSFGDVWGFASSELLEPGTQYVKVSGSNAGSSSYSDYVACFADGTRIRTASGDVAVEDIQTGDIIWTLDAGPQPVRWIATTQVRGNGAFAPVVFAPGAIGNETELLVSQEHRIWVSNAQNQMLFGADEVLVAAKHLVGLPGVRIEARDRIDYTHFMFDAHRIVAANGALTESFFLSDVSLRSLDQDAQDELLALFPKAAIGYCGFGATAALALKRGEAELLRDAALRDGWLS